MTLANQAVVDWLNSNGRQIEELVGETNRRALTQIAEAQAGTTDPHKFLTEAINTFHEETAGHAVEEWVLLVEQQRVGAPMIVATASTPSLPHAVGILNMALAVVQRGGEIS